MSSVNAVFLMGNLTRDPETRATPGGTTVGDLCVAVSESFRDKNGEAVTQTCFVDVVIWGRQADACAEYLRKGSPVMIEGKLQLDQWQTREGENRSRLRVRAMRVQFLHRKPAGEDAAAVPGKQDTRPDASAARTSAKEASHAIPF